MFLCQVFISISSISWDTRVHAPRADFYYRRARLTARAILTVQVREGSMLYTSELSEILKSEMVPVIQLSNTCGSFVTPHVESEKDVHGTLLQDGRWFPSTAFIWAPLEWNNVWPPRP